MRLLLLTLLCSVNAFAQYNSSAGHNAPAQGRLIEQLQRALVQQGISNPVPVTHSYVRTLPDEAQ